METVGTCPLGSVCEEAKDGKIYRCEWLVRTENVDAFTGQVIPGSGKDRCGIPIISLHLTELKKGTRGVQSAIESSRNESVERQDKLLNIVGEQHAALPRQ